MAARAVRKQSRFIGELPGLLGNLRMPGSRRLEEFCVELLLLDAACTGDLGDIWRRRSAGRSPNS
jgi:hypothetical protein